MQIFSVALFEQKLNKLLDQLNISRISGIRASGYLAGYPAGPSGIRPDTGYKKGRIVRPDIRCITTRNQCQLNS
jgi:hypothetical protein